LASVVQRLQPTTSCAVEQLGLAMMPFLMPPLEHVGVDFGTIKGTWRSMRQYGIVDHDGARFGDPGRPLLGNCASRRHQAEIGALEVKLVERLDLSAVARQTSVPVERVEASATTSLAGNWRSARTLSISGRHCRGANDCDL